MARTLRRGRGLWALIAAQAAVAALALLAAPAHPRADVAVAATGAPCASCHTEAAAHWASSAHASAWTDPLVVAERGESSPAWCASCHQPSGQSDGIGCADCHSAGGLVLTSRAPSAAGLAAHPMRRANWDGVRECATCHEFHFPDATQTRRVVFAPDGWLQRTVQEWRASDAAARGQTCVSCHMREGHGLLTGRAAADLVDVTTHARRTASGVALHATLTSQGVGHSLPTGDVYRSLELRAWPLERPSAVTSQRLARHFERGGDRLRREVRDTRIAPGEPRRVVLNLVGSEVEAVGWTLDLLRVPPERAARLRAHHPRRRLRAGRVAVEP